MIEPYHGSLWGFWLGAILFFLLAFGGLKFLSMLFPVTLRRDRPAKK